MKSIVRIASALALACLLLVASGPQADAHHGRGAASAVTNPLSLPLITASQIASNITFLGSFNLHNNSGGTNTGFVSGSAGLFTTGSTIYATGLYYNPQNGSNQYVPAVGSATMPSLSAITNGSMTGGSITATTISAPNREITYTAPTSYTLSAAPVTGATSLTLPSAPPSGITPSASGAPSGWYVQVTNGSGVVQTQELVTSVSGDTLGWTAGLPSNTYGTTVYVYQWTVPYPWGFASGDQITGTLAYGGNVYVSGAAYYDASCNINTGWIVQSNTSSTSWGGYNTLGSYSALQSRQFAGALGLVPAAWQSLLGGNPAYIAAQSDGISIISCYVPIGFALATFNPSSISATAGNAATGNIYLQYNYQGAPQNAYPQQITGRALSGPFPLTASSYYPATLSSAPTTGATTLSLSLPAGTVNVTANVTDGSENFVVTAVNSGTISNTEIAYEVTGTGVANCVTGGSNYKTLVPAWDAGPGNPTGTGTYTLCTGATATCTACTYTLTPQGYIEGYYQLTLNNGDQRIAHLEPNNASVPAVTSGTNDLTVLANPLWFAAPTPTVGAVSATLATQGGATYTWPYPSGAYTVVFSDQETKSATFTNGSSAISWSGGLTGQTFSNAWVEMPLTGSSYTTSITIAPMSDNLYVPYNGNFGTGFIWPGTRSYVAMGLQNNGPETFRGPVCNTGASGSNSTPITPDTALYTQWQVSAYDMQGVLNASEPYAPTPYLLTAFPDWTAFTYTNGCLTPKASGWLYFDSTTNLLYATFSTSVAGNSGNEVVEVWQLTPITSLSDAWLDQRNQPIRAANDDHYNLQEAAA